MIVANEKKLDDIVEMVKEYNRILVLSCGTCTTVCRSGGQREAEDLASRIQNRLEAQANFAEVRVAHIERHCEVDFIRDLMPEAEWAEAIVSLGCGAGVQTLAEVLGTTPVFPGLDTVFIGSYVGEGKWSEMCSSCGDCLLHLTGGVCPVARCAKKLLNGPCGGSHQGACEVGHGKACAWQLIYDRLKALGRLHLLDELSAFKNWNPDEDDVGPRKRIVQGVEHTWK